MKKYMAIILVLIMLFSITACGNEQITEEVSASVDVINPVRYYDNELILYIYDGLMRIGVDGTAEPNLIRTWEYNEETFTYTVFLRSSVQWHDEEDFVADDVLFTVDIFKEIAPFDEKLALISKIISLDDLTLSIQLKQDDDDFLSCLYFPILPKHILQNKDVNDDTSYAKPIGTGCYSYEKTKNDKIFLTKFRGDYIVAGRLPDKLTVLISDGAKEK